MKTCGQMSAWYVLNSMGFYQVCPGKPVYSIGRPAFDKAVVNLPSGKKFSIVVKNNTKKNKLYRKHNAERQSAGYSVLQPSGHRERRNDRNQND